MNGITGRHDLILFRTRSRYWTLSCARRIVNLQESQHAVFKLIMKLYWWFGTLLFRGVSLPHTFPSPSCIVTPHSALSHTSATPRPASHSCHSPTCLILNTQACLTLLPYPDLPHTLPIPRSSSHALHASTFPASFLPAPFLLLHCEGHEMLKYCNRRRTIFSLEGRSSNLRPREGPP